MTREITLSQKKKILYIADKTTPTNSNFFYNLLLVFSVKYVRSQFAKTKESIVSPHTLISLNKKLLK